MIKKKEKKFYKKNLNYRSHIQLKLEVCLFPASSKLVRQEDTLSEFQQKEGKTSKLLN